MQINIIAYQAVKKEEITTCDHELAVCQSRKTSPINILGI